MLNRVILIGRMANDPEPKTTPSGVSVCSFRIAVNRPPNAQGEREADFIDVVAWRQAADFAANYLGKGRLIAIEGRLQVRSWTAQDGTRRRTAEVVVDNLKALDRPKETTSNSSYGDQGGHGHFADHGNQTAQHEDIEPDYADPFAGE